ncbi:hypothetical protein [Rhizobium sp. BK456]|uniref:hypothetical protein n=1 Tax=Rhizobium sp. BK456 TaxID=2587007 RepID=UPI0016109B69|nr:hypothetical protein [Rhizobium sp. BK456]MBB3521001.1 hypothetical protein [Rhizobium sp. BK456]
MPHVRTQLRNAVKTRLSTVPSIKSAQNASRFLRKFQDDNLPIALVGVSETVTQAAGSMIGQQPQTRSYTIHVRLGVHGDDDVEDRLEQIAVDVEKALLFPVTGIGKISNWKYAGAEDLAPAEIECGILCSQLLTYTADIWTLDAEPDRNLHA